MREPDQAASSFTLSLVVLLKLKSTEYYWLEYSGRSHLGITAPQDQAARMGIRLLQGDARPAARLLLDALARATFANRGCRGEDTPDSYCRREMQSLEGGRGSGAYRSGILFGNVPNEAASYRALT